jgi:hypothetical protein
MHCPMESLACPTEDSAETDSTGPVQAPRVISKRCWLEPLVRVIKGAGPCPNPAKTDRWEFMDKQTKREIWLIAVGPGRAADRLCCLHDPQPLRR